MKKIIYADNAATTRLSPKALEAMMPFLTSEYANPSQPYSFAREARKAIAMARKIIADCINATPEEIIFTSGGTESNNTVIAYAIQNEIPIVTSAIEHHAVLNACQCSQSLSVVPVDKYGRIDERVLRTYLGDQCLVSIMIANNEIGTIQDIKQMSEYTHNQGCLFHTDAVQAIGHINVDVKDINVDFLSASAHKFNGPKGIGFLYKKRNTSLIPLLKGGSQESNFRAGTENVASIIGMAVALQENIEEIEDNIRNLNQLEAALFEILNSANIDYIRNGINQLPGNVSISFKGQYGEAMLHRLDLKGIMVSTGSACDSVNTQISHVLKAINIDESYAKGTIRISFGKNNIVDDAVEVAKALISITKGHKI